MGNLLGCFGAPKKEKRRRPTCQSTPEGKVNRQHHELVRPSPTVKQTLEAQVVDDVDSVLRGGTEQLSFSSPKKKVTFNLNVQTYEESPLYEEDLSTSIDVDGLKATVKEEREKGVERSVKSSGFGTYPLHHRYQNCTNSDDEDDEDGGDDGEGYDDDNEDEEEHNFYELDDNYNGIVDRENEEEEESFDSYFSLQMDRDKELQVFKGVNSDTAKSSISSHDEKLTLQGKQTTRGRSNHVHPILNPVENLSQWKVVKAKEAAPTKHPNKENINVEEGSTIPISPEPNISFQKPQKSCNSTPSSIISSVQEEPSVDASLSSWLTPPKGTPVKCSPGTTSPYRSKSSASLDERPILGALTVEDLKQSAASSPRKSPSKSPDEMPIVGTVGSYWNHTNQEADSCSSRSSNSVTKGIPNTTSKYREDKRVNWHSTPFEVRLEKALNNGPAGAYSGFPPVVMKQL